MRQERHRKWEQRRRRVSTLGPEHEGPDLITARAKKTIESQSDYRLGEELTARPNQIKDRKEKITAGANRITD